MHSTFRTVNQAVPQPFYRAQHACRGGQSFDLLKLLMAAAFAPELQTLLVVPTIQYFLTHVLMYTCPQRMRGERTVQRMYASNMASTHCMCQWYPAAGDGSVVCVLHQKASE
jgi:hypothetical protein